ncbi:hypothetical protein EZS27_033875 [termite gut metagenome]|uniref:DUF3696 domain-containing protein n=1 Tax=termite gut metagenome TaxID=433724 RepID=A0A5J4Q3S3_9ZZZZ
MLEKAANKENNILLDGHGSIEEIKNNRVKENISLQVRDENNHSLTATISLSSDLKIDIKDTFDYPEVIYISANRFGPQTSIPIYNNSAKKDRIGKNGENLLQCIELLGDTVLDERLRHVNAEGDTLEYNIRGWLNTVSPNVGFKFHLEKMSDSSYSMFDEHRANNVGFGLSYTLPVITALLMGTFIKNSLVIIENPEAHLHPKGQTELARLAALCAVVGAQIIVETHSDHFFDGIRIAAKRHGIAEDVQIHWFELNEHKNTEVYSPILSEDGRVSEWPKGFFDQFEINASELI